LTKAAIQSIRHGSEPEAQLARSEERYRGLLEAAPDAMVVVDAAGKIVLLNVQAEKQFGYSRDELIGHKVTDIIPTGFAERLIADGSRTSAEALAQQIGTGTELIGQRDDGSEFPIEIMLSPLDSPDGMLVTAGRAADREVQSRGQAVAGRGPGGRFRAPSVVPSPLGPYPPRPPVTPHHSTRSCSIWSESSFRSSA
jgi:PAS domain S-box-containing protein